MLTVLTVLIAKTIHASCLMINPDDCIRWRYIWTKISAVNNIKGLDGISHIEAIISTMAPTAKDVLHQLVKRVPRTKQCPSG